ncbi:MAG TPA: response regulator [Dehalococcoidia bacterium]|nr:response regulator [Dehalococcoidia bacterium]
MSARIVVADDEADIRRLIVFTLKRRGYQVLEASAGDAALDLIRRERPDLAVLDVMMPGLTGLEVAGALGADPATRSIPIVMLSAKGQSVEIEAGLASGARAYLVKPFAPQDLAARVAEILAGS